LAAAASAWAACASAWALLLRGYLCLLLCRLRLLYCQLLLLLLLLLHLAQRAHACIFRVLHRAPGVGDHYLALAVLAVKRLRVLQLLLSLGKNIRRVLRCAHRLGDLHRIDRFIKLQGRLIAWFDGVQNRVLARSLHVSSTRQ
jgi:hypothetical protein